MAAGPTITTAPAAVAAQIEAALRADLCQRNPQGTNRAISLCGTGPDGGVIAGLTGETSYGWLHIDVLWVAPGWRRQGHGRALVQEAIRRARGSGCHGVWLDTSDPGARRFYHALGFRPFGRLKNTENQAPAGHRRWFLRRRIS